MASKCRTAFVEPPSEMTTVMAFSNAFLVRMSSGLMPSSNILTTAAPARRQSSSFEGAGHRVGRVHPAARARPGNGALLHCLKFRVRNFFVRVRADGFKHRNNI